MSDVRWSITRLLAVSKVKMEWMSAVMFPPRAGRCAMWYAMNVR
jgi:hypothetical protein